MGYKFYVQMEGETYGPYTAKEIRDLQLMDDILVTEESMSEWLPAGRFDFDDMVMKELGASINEDCTINRSGYGTPTPSSITSVAPQPQLENTPTYADEIPSEIKGWNWGAFFFSWIWGVCNGVYWSLLLILGSLISYIDVILGALISWGGCIVLGINGNKWAWKAKSWSSIAEFKRVQHEWTIAALWVFGILVLIGLISIVASM